jgi:hypothetical protein
MMERPSMNWNPSIPQIECPSQEALGLWATGNENLLPYRSKDFSHHLSHCDPCWRTADSLQRQFTAFYGDVTKSWKG